MPILNYTTKVPVDKTIADMQKILAKANARSIITDYDLKEMPCGLVFEIVIKDQSMHFKLPVNIMGVSEALKRDGAYRDDAHARRVAWRIAKDWVEAQMAIVRVNMADMVQVFLPYAETANGDTVYQLFKTKGLLALAAPPGKDG